MSSRPFDAQPPSWLSISELSSRTGVEVSTLRMWESRYGFPRPERSANGHRRYPPSDVALVLDVRRHHESGLRMEAAVAAVVTQANDGHPIAPSVFAALRHSAPQAPTRTLRKSTLLALSWAIEDECASRAEPCFVFGAFQAAGNYRRADARWSDLAEVATGVYAFVVPDHHETSPRHSQPRPHIVPLPSGHPMRREWAVVCDGGTLPVALSAWERPGQDEQPDADRLFETVWTIEPAAVRIAARVCAAAAVEAGVPQASTVLAALGSSASETAVDGAATTRLVSRIISYLDAPSQSLSTSR